MFIEEKRQGEIQVQLPSMAGFIVWLGQQDPKARFDFSSFTECPCARYARTCGYRGHSWVSSTAFNAIHSQIAAYMRHKWSIIRPTYGALLKFVVHREQA